MMVGLQAQADVFGTDVRDGWATSRFVRYS
jgi:hypothetical protein